MDEEKILSSVTDRNVTHLDTVEKALRGMLPSQREMQRQRQRPGTRADGGMAPTATYTHNTQALVQQILENERSLENALADARRLVDNFEEEQHRQEDEILQLKATLEEERNQCAMLQNRCEQLKEVLRNAATIMVNGGKDKE